MRVLPVPPPSPASSDARPRRRRALARVLSGALAALALLGATAEAAGPALPPLSGASPTLPALPPPGPLGGLLGRPRPPAPPRPSRPPPSRCPGVSAPGRAPYAGAVFPCDFPDPMVLKVGREWYAYATGTGWEAPGHLFPVLRSTDMRHWSQVGDAFLNPPAWSRGDVWAPSVVRAHGRYFMYYSATRRGDNLHCVAVATASRPVGPFRHRRIISCGDRKGRGYIDAAPLVDRDRRVYLYLSVDVPHTLSVLRLRRDLIHAAGPHKALLGPTRRWQRGLDNPTLEGPSIVRHGRLYYLFYSAGSWLTDYRMGYAVAHSASGPFRDYSSNPILSSPGLVAPGGGSVAVGPGRSLWLAFHAWTGGPGYGRARGQRTLRIAPLHWRGARVTVTVRGGSR